MASEQEPESTEEPLSNVQIEVENYEDTEAENTQGEQLQPVRHSQRVRKTPIRYGVDEYADTANYAVDEVIKVEEPVTIEDALSCNHSEEWKSAADLEYSSLLDNETWELVKLPEGWKTVGCKWVFRVKYDVKAESSALKVDLLHTDIRKSTVSTMMKYLLLLPVSHQSISSLHLQLRTK